MVKLDRIKQCPPTSTKEIVVNIQCKMTTCTILFYVAESFTDERESVILVNIKALENGAELHSIC